MTSPTLASFTATDGTGLWEVTSAGIRVNGKLYRFTDRSFVVCAVTPGRTERSTNLIEEEALLGSVSVVSSLTHGNVALAEVMVLRMRHFSNEDGVLIDEVPLPDNAIIAAIASGGDVEVANDETVLHPGDKAIVVADEDVLDDVRLAFRGL